MAEEVKVKITAKDDASAKLQRIGKSTQNMSAAFRKAGIAMTAMGVAMALALGKMVTSYAKAGDEIAKMAKRTKFSTVALSELRHVAKITGTDLSMIEKATKKMSKTIVDAGYGLETYTRIFDQLGLSIQDIQAMQPEEQFWTIATAMANLEDHTMKVAIAQDMFGRAGTKLLPMLEETAEGIAALRQEAHDLGIVFDEEAAAKAEAFQDAAQRLKESLQGVAFAMADTLVPIITEFLENKLVPIIKKVTDWVAANEGLAKSLAVVAGIFMVGGVLLLGLGLVAKAIMAINAALVVMHALMGPAGWLKLAAGIAIAGGAILAINKLTAAPKLPEMKHGGVVPGPMGMPVPIMAHGGERFAGAGKPSGAVNIYIGSFMGDESSLKAFSRKIGEIMGQDTRRTSFAGINRLEYFPGSSAP